jgi:hypothetical protein
MQEMQESLRKKYKEQRQQEAKMEFDQMEAKQQVDQLAQEAKSAHLKELLAFLSEKKLKPINITTLMCAETWNKYADSAAKNTDVVLYFLKSVATARWFNTRTTNQSNCCLFHGDGYTTLRLAKLTSHEKARLNRFLEGKEALVCAKCKAMDVVGSECVCGALVCDPCRKELSKGKLFFPCPSCPALRASQHTGVLEYIKSKHYRASNVTEHMSAKTFARYLQRSIEELKWVIYFTKTPQTQDYFRED